MTLIGYTWLEGQDRRSNVKNCVWTSLLVALYLALRSRSKVEVKIRGQGSRSDVKGVAVNIRGSSC